MNPIIVNMDDLSDSTEVYESKPHPIVAGFIWLVLILVGIAVAWAATFKMDIVVKGTGIVETRQDSSVVTNLQAGTIAACYVTDGQWVNEGDLLYTIEDRELALETTDYENQMQENDSRLEILNAYLNWLTDQSVDLDAYADNPYYEEYKARSKIVAINMENVATQFNTQQDSYEAKQTANSSLIAYYETEVNNLLELSAGIKSRVNTFSPEDTYYYAKLDNYITEYNNTIKQYDDSIAVLQKELEDANNEVKDADSDITESENAIQDAENAISNAKDRIEAAQTAAVASESTQNDDSTVQEVSGEETAQTQETVAEETAAVDTSADESLIAQKQSELASAQTAKETAESTKKTQEALVKTKSNAIATAKLEKESALSALETETIAGIEASILTYRQNIISTNASQAETQTALVSLEQTGTALEQENVVQSEIQAVSAEISTYNLKALELENAIKTVNNAKEKTQLKAPISGVVNLAQELTAGNYLSAGAQVMTIIPQDEDSYLICSYIDNQDIAKIKEGMAVKYEIAAYPSSEYGAMTGQVEFVSADLKTGGEDGSAYYVVESSVDSTDLYNQNGEQAELKVGMYCETKIIVEQKSVLKILLEKIHLID